MIVLSIFLSLTTQTSINVEPIIQRIDEIHSSSQLTAAAEALEGIVGQINSVRSTVSTAEYIR